MSDHADLRRLVEEYEIRGVESTFIEAKRRLEAALRRAPDDVDLLVSYGYLLECHARSELRTAAERYRRAIELDPRDDRPRWQLISAMTALFDTGDLIDAQRERLAAAPEDVREYRFLAASYVRAGDAERAAETIRKGREIAGEDAVLTSLEAEAHAREGRVDDALAAWRRSVELDPNSIGGRYMSAYLLEREGRIDEALNEWRAILDWNAAHGNDLAAEFPKRELERVAGKSAP